MLWKIQHEIDKFLKLKGHLPAEYWTKHNLSRVSLLGNLEVGDKLILIGQCQGPLVKGTWEWMLNTSIFFIYPEFLSISWSFQNGGKSVSHLFGNFHGKFLCPSRRPKIYVEFTTFSASFRVLSSYELCVTLPKRTELCQIRQFRMKERGLYHRVSDKLRRVLFSGSKAIIS